MTDFAASSSAAPPRGLPWRLLGDERLARLAAAGSERAFAALYERHHQALYRYCRTIVRHDEDAQDALQTTMARALAALARGVPDAPVRPWLFRIAHNEAVSVLRRRRPTTDLDRAAGVLARPLEAHVEERSRLTALVDDLNELPERQRSALVMRELSGLSHEEIAAALEISVSAAKQAIFDARTGLQEFARGRAMDCADVQRIVSERDGRMLRGRPVRAHLRGCGSCRALCDAIRTRRADLGALAPPLPATAAGGLLASILGGGAGAGAGAGVVSALGGALTGKVLTGAAIVATVSVAASHGLPLATSHDGPRRPAASGAVSRATPAGADVRAAASTPASRAATPPSSGQGRGSTHARTGGTRRPDAPPARGAESDSRVPPAGASHGRGSAAGSRATPRRRPHVAKTRTTGPPAHAASRRRPPSRGAPARRLRAAPAPRARPARPARPGRAPAAASRASGGHGSPAGRAGAGATPRRTPAHAPPPVATTLPPGSALHVPPAGPRAGSPAKSVGG